MWYVVQVIKGTEDAMAELIGRVASPEVLDECFVPKFATEVKVRGRWVPAQKELFPGYLIAVTDRPEALEDCLVQLPEFARVLRMGAVFAPLASDEVELIAGFTRKGERVVPMSRAVKEGDRVVVTEGPLVGREAQIRSIDRRKSTAVLEFDLCGRAVGARMGLAVLSAPGEPEARRAELYRREALARA